MGRDPELAPEGDAPALDIVKTGSAVAFPGVSSLVSSVDCRLLIAGANIPLCGSVACGLTYITWRSVHTVHDR